MPLIKGLRSTTVWRAFLLNSLVSSIIIVLAITVKGMLDKYTVDSKTKDKKGANVTRRTTWYSILITFVVTFAATYGSFALMYWVFGYGGGMLVNMPSKKS